MCYTLCDCWLLKGGFALDLRLAERARATRDIDIEWRAAEEELLAAFLDPALAAEPGLARWDAVALKWQT